MSYDIYVEAEVGGEDRWQIDSFNYTTNCSPMWKKAMPETDGLAGLDGKKCDEVVEILEEGITAMRKNPEIYQELNPKNGWGDFEGQLDMLERLVETCRAAPLAYVRIWR